MKGWCRRERAHFMQLPGKRDSSGSLKGGSQGALPQMGKKPEDWEVGAHYMPAGLRKERPKARE